MSGWGDPYYLDALKTPARCERFSKLQMLIDSGRGDTRPDLPGETPGERRRRLRKEQLEERFAQMREGNRKRVVAGDSTQHKMLRVPRVAELIERVASQMDVPAGLVVSGGKYAGEVSAARRLAAVEMRSWGWSLPRIGLVLGCHHTSVIYMIRRREPAPAKVSVSSRPERKPAAYEIPYPDLSGEWAI